MPRFRREVHRAAEHVENAAIDVPAHVPAKIGVERFGVAAAQAGGFVNADAIQVRRDGRAHAGDTFEIAYWSCHVSSSMPDGS